MAVDADDWLARQPDLAVRTVELYRHLPDAALRYQHATKDRDRVLAEALASLATPAPIVPLRADRPNDSRPDRAHGVS